MFLIVVSLFLENPVYFHENFAREIFFNCFLKVIMHTVDSFNLMSNETYIFSPFVKRIIRLEYKL